MKPAAWTLLAFCAALASLDGCATYHPHPISPAETAAAFEARSLEDPRLRKFLEQTLGHDVRPWPPASWNFTLLSLVAFYEHPDLEVARASWKVATAGAKTAGERPNPTLQISPEYATNAGSGVSPWVLGFSLDVPIETAGKWKIRIAQARNLSEAARLKIATTVWKVRSRLRERLLDLFAARKSESILGGSRAMQQENVSLLERRQAAGDLSLPTLNQARLNFERTELSFTEAQKQAAESRVRVADAMGLRVAALDRIALQFDFVDLFTPAKKVISAEVRRRALTNRPDILEALAEYAASESALRLEIAKQYPDIHLGPGYLFDQGQNKWTLGLSVSLPIFNHNQGGVAEAEAKRTEAEARFIALQARVIGEIDETLAGYRASLKKLEAADRLLATQRRQRQFVVSMTQAGEVNRLARLTAESEFDQASLARLNAQMEAQRALGRLEDAVQRPVDTVGVIP